MVQVTCEGGVVWVWSEGIDSRLLTPAWYLFRKKILGWFLYFFPPWNLLTFCIIPHRVLNQPAHL